VSISPVYLLSTPADLVAWIEAEVASRVQRLRTDPTVSTHDLIAWGRAHDVMKLMRMLAALDPSMNIHNPREFLDAVREQTLFTTEMMTEYKALSQRLHEAEAELAVLRGAVPTNHTPEYAP
jgi:hypothetical protein